MRAVVLAGGLGTRLRPYTTVLPKPLLPVGDQPILELVLRQLAAAGIRRVDLCVSHLGELIASYFAQADSVPAGLDLAFRWEDEALGTAGALRMVPDLDETFLVMNGDVLTTLDYAAFLAYHREHGAPLTIACQQRVVDVPLGVVEQDGADVTTFHEKPRLTYTASMGVYAYEPSALAYLPEGVCQFPDFVTALLDAGQRVAAFSSDATFYDVGTLDEHERAVNDFVARRDAFLPPSAG